jgi:GNAT superfamily N-acetyltransferase
MCGNPSKGICIMANDSHRVPLVKFNVVTSLPGELKALSREATLEGFAHLDRLIEEWNSGANRFNRSGEVLLAGFLSDRLIAVGGLNQDPFDAAPSAARLRRVYVKRANRRNSVGRGLVELLCTIARKRFDRVNLYTSDQTAANFYEKLGFEKSVSLSKISHTFRIV